MSNASKMGRGGAVLILILIVTSRGGGQATAAATVVDQVARASSQPAPAKRPFYDFSSPNTPDGFCETQVFGRHRLVAEPINALFSLTATFLGLLGLFRSKRTTMAFQGLFALLAAYGVFSALRHATLMNGFYRMEDVTLGFLQSFTLIMLVHTLCLHASAHAKSRGLELGTGARLIASATTLVFTLYPAVAHVWGEASADSNVAFYVFDGLAAGMTLPLLLIWRSRATWPGVSKSSLAFRLALYTPGATAIAYLGWCLDHYRCSRMVAFLLPHGWWHLFISLGFYFPIVLCRYLSAHEYGYDPELDSVRVAGVVELPFVEWVPAQPGGPPAGEPAAASIGQPISPVG